MEATIISGIGGSGGTVNDIEVQDRMKIYQWYSRHHRKNIHYERTKSQIRSQTASDFLSCREQFYFFRKERHPLRKPEIRPNRWAVTLIFGWTKVIMILMTVIVIKSCLFSFDMLCFCKTKILI